MALVDLDAWRSRLPIAEAVPRVAAALAESGAAVLVAAPGAGKTTLVPLALLGSAWLGRQRAVMLEPRRLAARASARRMAAMLGESVGETVGYRTRLDVKVGPSTRLEVVTEGILVRMLQADAALEGTGLVIFDEFHERSLDGDLGLALTLEARRALRPDLRLLVMSATLDGRRVASLLEGAPVIESPGRLFSVETRYLERPPADRIDEGAARAIALALREQTGSLLVFLPGIREIRRVERRLRERDLPADVRVTPLYGDLPQPAQDAAIETPGPRTRKIVLATSIAETSLTIDGVRVVIDGGLSRRARFDPRTGMARLVTERVSQASAEQRRGRAGRLEPGVCYRLWPAHEQALLAPFAPPEIMEADLAPLVLELARWGATDPTTLSWLDPPPASAVAQARGLLRALDALDADGRITGHGCAMASLGFHPRLAHMMLRAREAGRGALACDVAALLSERDILRPGLGPRDCDLRLRLELLRGASPRDLGPDMAVDRGSLQRAREQARQWRKQLGIADATSPLSAAGAIVALAYPDRVAQRRKSNPGSFRLANGSGAVVSPSDPLSAAEFLAVAALDGDPRNARVYLAAPLPRSDLEADFAEHIEHADLVAWDAREEAVLARRQERLGALVLRDEPLADPPSEAVRAALLKGLRALGLEALPWTSEASALRERIRFARRIEEGDWPDLSDAAMLAGLADWLGPFVEGITRRSQLRRVDLARALRASLSREQQRRLDALAPTHVAVPSGSRVPIDYGAGETPVVAVRLQEMFGLAKTPAVADGRVPLLLHLLSPAGRPLQVTRDLGRFWATSYAQVRAEMRGRYPKHDWPESPLTAAPTTRTKRRR